MTEPTRSASASNGHSVRLLITDDLRRRRLTAIFRPILALPHLLWIVLLTVLVLAVAIVNWFATLFRGRSPDALHHFLADYLRYATHVAAYILLIADPFPGFLFINLSDAYPVDLEVDSPEEQNRWTVAFRLILAIPALIVAGMLRNLSTVLGLFSWVVAIAQERVPEGVRNFSAFALRFEVQAYAYVLLASRRYPNFNVSITD
jgi:Domain of unknown function (DUF4389)